MFPDSAMGIDSGTSLPWPSCNRRLSLTPVKIRLREERKRVIRALDAKYRTIDDHERGMRKFVLIKNNLRRLQREAREEKLARHRAGVTESKVSNFSPSCLSAATRPRSPSPPFDYGYPDSPVPALSANSPLFGSDEPLCKRQRLFFDDDKENEMESSMEEDSKASSPCRPVDEAQEILRDLYETCVNEGITQRATNPELSHESSYSESIYQSRDSSSTSFSLSMSTSCSSISSVSDSSGDGEWSRHHHQYPFNCGHSSLLGNDLQSVVFHSLITSLES